MERVVQANGIDIWCEDFGEPGDPAILLVMGSGTSGKAWPVDLCEDLAAAGYHVVRYDNRDTGKSTLVDFEQRPYTLVDLAADAAGLLDALGIDAAHVVGVSMGGMVAQEIAIHFPERVKTLTSVISTPAVRHPRNPIGWSGGLPRMKLRAVAAFVGAAIRRPKTREERVKLAVKTARATTGSLGLLDVDDVRKMCEEELDHAVDPDHDDHHGRALAASQDRTAALGSVSVPTLVVHGSEDPIFPYEHGVATAKAVPGARLVMVEGLGHELPPDLATLVIEHIRAY